MFITQKIHGTNAQVYVYKTTDGLLDLKVGSRTRWITPEQDNYGFARFVYANKEAFLALGPGRHFGEWAGPGINSGEGPSQKTFILFDFWKFPPERTLPPQTVVVPILYKGKTDLNQIQVQMDLLKYKGSSLVPGFMRPEGIVVTIAGQRFKNVFDNEETKWIEADQKYRDEKDTNLKEGLEKYGHLLQPIRLEKLLSKDETYTVDYPKSMTKIVSDYFEDLVIEIGLKPEEILKAKRALGKNVYTFVKEIVEK